MSHSASLQHMQVILAYNCAGTQTQCSGWRSQPTGPWQHSGLCRQITRLTQISPQPISFNHNSKPPDSSQGSQ
uniref:Uncharacterized protein n=1 Tax=Anguilla anguilla TaxID=7936 RepID=A0A0E9PLC9_ANGAN